MDLHAINEPGVTDGSTAYAGSLARPRRLVRRANMNGWLCLLGTILPVCLLIVTGCSSMRSFFDRDRTDHIPGITLPAERIALIRKKGEAAASLSPAQAEPVARDLAREYRQQPDPMIRGEVVKALARFPGESAQAVLAEAVEDSDTEVRVAACNAWAMRRDPQGVELLTDRIQNDSEVEVRLAATSSLGKIGSPDAIESLGVALEDRDPAIQFQAVQSLRAATDEDFGGDVHRWRQYLNGEPVAPDESPSIAERVKSLF